MDGHIADAVGRPDLVRLEDGLVCLRFETMKVVSALAAVRHLLDTGAVRRGDTLLDSSSGIYAYALALACHRYGMRCHIVGSTTVDRALRTQLAVLGATVERVEPSSDLKLDQKRRVARVAEILRERPDVHWMRQYHDDVHYLGYRAVADRIRAEVVGRDGRGDGRGALTLVGGVGSGASTGALARYLREAGTDVELVGVQPFGSVTFGSEHVADPEIVIAGIGSSIPFGNVAHSSYDTVHWVSYEAALAGSVDLLRRHAVFAGLSTGAGYLAARWERDAARRERGAARGGPGAPPAGGRTVLFVAPDTGHRYVESVFARHERARPVSELAPREVTDTGELALPWARMRWGRRGRRRVAEEGTGSGG
ncbi:pyridoxal-phosphate dependent enzyme [Streptomyces sp. NPDC050504]|uniref:pyridoxal-phosphate dependent enzyme n=1 Tax=Streptomyces sp. NPDC050504 TaxID=3365618 RepID=UPI0037AC8E09